MNKLFDLEAAKRGEPILFDGEPATFVAYLPDNEPAYRVILSCSGQVHAFTEDGRYCEAGESRLTMAPRKERTSGYRAFYTYADGKLIRSCAWESCTHFTPQWSEEREGFVRWIHHEWQYDEVDI